jgi:hypothetical protein
MVDDSHFITAAPPGTKFNSEYFDLTRPRSLLLEEIEFYRMRDEEAKVVYMQLNAMMDQDAWSLIRRHELGASIAFWDTGIEQLTYGERYIRDKALAEADIAKKFKQDYAQEANVETLNRQKLKVLVDKRARARAVVADRVAAEAEDAAVLIREGGARAAVIAEDEAIVVDLEAGRLLALEQPALLSMAKIKFDQLLRRFGKVGLRDEYNTKKKVFVGNDGTTKGILVKYLRTAEGAIVREGAVPLEAAVNGNALVRESYA